MPQDRDGEQVKSAYLQTRSLRAAGVMLDCSATTVRRHLVSLGVPRGAARRKRRPSFPPGQAALILDRYHNGKESLAALACDYGCSDGKIRRLLEFEGVPIRPRGRPSAPTPPAPPAGDVKRLHGQGLRPADIAARLICTKEGVLEVLRAEQLTPNRGKPLPPDSALRDRGRSVRDLARQYGVSEDRIREARMTAAQVAEPMPTADGGCGARPSVADSSGPAPCRARPGHAA
jgi:hypothetical protein